MEISPLLRMRETWTISAKSCPERLIRGWAGKQNKSTFGSFLPPLRRNLTIIFIHRNTQIYACTFSPAPLVDSERTNGKPGEGSSVSSKQLKWRPVPSRSRRNFNRVVATAILTFLTHPANSLKKGWGHSFRSIFVFGRILQDQVLSSLCNRGNLAERTTECCLCSQPFFRCRVAPLHDTEMILI